MSLCKYCGLRSIVLFFPGLRKAVAVVVFNFTKFSLGFADYKMQNIPT